GGQPGARHHRHVDRHAHRGPAGLPRVLAHRLLTPAKSPEPQALLPACAGTGSGAGSASASTSGGRIAAIQPASAIGQTEYPHRVAGASVNITVSPSARRQAAARASAGGRTISETAKPSPAAISRATAAQCPASPVVASRCPGSGLAAGVLCVDKPSGNSTV